MATREDQALAALAAWRSLSRDEQAAAFEATTRATGFDPEAYRAIKLLVWECDYRGGPALECGCTRTRICLAGKGRPIPGTDVTDVTDVTDKDCERCVQDRNW